MDQRHHQMGMVNAGQQEQQPGPMSILKKTLVTTAFNPNERTIDSHGTRTLVLDQHLTNYKLIDVLESKYFVVTFVSLLITAIGNLMLTLWIVNALHLGHDGLGSGQLQFLRNGLDIRIPAYFDQLTAATIRATSNPDPLLVEPKEETITMSSNDGRSSITLGRKKLEIQSPRFVVMDENEEESTFEISPGEMVIRGQNDVNQQQFSSGYKVLEAISTDSVTGTTNHDLKVESRVGNIAVKGQSVDIESRAGNVVVFSLHQLELNSMELKIDSKRTSLKGLQISTAKEEKATENGFTVCTFEDGKLFLSTSPSCLSSQFIDE